jgi:NAD(P)H-hydrate epimerase
MRLPEDRLPRAVYTAAAVRGFDSLASTRWQIPTYELMRRAGEGALRSLRARWPAAGRVLVYCGPGNNGGDGYVLALLAKAAGLDARVAALTERTKLSGDAAEAEREASEGGVEIRAFEAGHDDFAAEVTVDALLGTGANRELQGKLAAAVEAINESGVPVLALDIPSGLHAERGLPLGNAVRATATVTFGALKQGLYLGSACDYVGAIDCCGLDLPPEVAAGEPPALVRLGREDLERVVPRRPRSAHKGSSGRLLVIGGGPGMPGAVRLAAEAALRTGAGLVYVAAHPDSAASIAAGRAEVICEAVARADDLDPLLARADGIVLGPGLGRSEWARDLWARALESELPLVADADALNLLAAAPRRRGRWILTPHPAEAGRLLGSDTGTVQRDRLEAVRELARRHSAVVVLKGANTLVAAPEAGAPVAVCDRGNPGMATAGTGDVLSGVLGALLVQSSDLAASARAGTLLHALAGDSAAAEGERGTLAGDLLPHLRRWANPF